MRAAAAVLVACLALSVMAALASKGDRIPPPQPATTAIDPDDDVDMTEHTPAFRVDAGFNAIYSGEPDDLVLADLFRTVLMRQLHGE